MDMELSNSQPSPARQRFLQRLAALAIKPAARDYYVRWAESWTKALGHRSAEPTQAFFDALGRTAHLADWQFRQAVDAVHILAHDVLALPWAAAYDWQGLSDQAKSLEPDHRTLGRETIQVRAVLSQSGSGILPQSVSGASRSAATSISLPDTDTEIARITDALTNYLNYLALERNVSAATQKQALNAMVFLTKKVFGVEEFMIEKPAYGHTNRRPPVVMTRDEVRSVVAHLDGAWKLAALLMYGSGLRIMECFATQLLQSSTDIRTVQDLPGHESVETTMIYLHVMKRPGAGAQSPLDLP